ncbi:uncharacterized protein LOC127831767 [Dreissena polymorpha]|uniref:Uncharacterized protein n=1 Tax=Dreissena polymorpha TaxID=45954 RepID=A0A9D4MU47_DREPO|nr:uncharacterized protein LOC127831767 [Dreissena polymorpha]KAH3882561.1 hypothetical protein DPMN_006503 [Dreissena polymorpha]
MNAVSALQISPNYITCAYKKIFETAAYKSLLQTEDENDTLSSDRDIAAKAVDAETFKVLSRSPLVHVDKSNSCIYTSASALVLQRSASQNDELCAWDVCERAHSASAYTHHRVDHAGFDGLFGRTSRFANFGAASPNVKNFSYSLRRIPSKDRLGSSKKRLDRSKTSSQGSAEPNKRDPGVTTPMACTTKTAVQRFRHFRRSCSYMDQYREEYTYKRLLESADKHPLPNDAVLLSACGSPNCSGLVTSSHYEHRWYPKQSVKPPAKVFESATTTSVNYAAPLPKRTPVLKKRPAPMISTKALASTRYVMQQVTRVMDEVFGCLKTSTDVPVSPGMYRIGLFATSLQVHSYNPTKSVRPVARSKQPSEGTLQNSEPMQFNRNN